MYAYHLVRTKILLLRPLMKNNSILKFIDTYRCSRGMTLFVRYPSVSVIWLTWLYTLKEARATSIHSFLIFLVCAVTPVQMYVHMGVCARFCEREHVHLCAPTKGCIACMLHVCLCPWHGTCSMYVYAPGMTRASCMLMPLVWHVFHVWLCPWHGTCFMYAYAPGMTRTSCMLMPLAWHVIYRLLVIFT